MMSKEELLAGIAVDPGVCVGKPCIKGYRIWVSLVLDLLAEAWSHHEVLENYPGLDDADILACITYGAEMTRERYIDIGGREVAGPHSGPWGPAPVGSAVRTTDRAVA